MDCRGEELWMVGVMGESVLDGVKGFFVLTKFQQILRGSYEAGWVVRTGVKEALGEVERLTNLL